MNNLSIINRFIFLINSLCLILLLFSYVSPFLTPKLFWPISFLGLLFPILIVTNLIFLLYWGILFKRSFFANLIIILIGVPYMQKYIGTHGNQNMEKGDTVKLLSYNVRLFNKYGWIPQENIQNKILDFINEESPDILCIQEFDPDINLADINLNYIHLEKKNKKEKPHMIIYSRYPQINKSTINMNGKMMKNTCMFSDIIIKKDTFRIYNIHLASNWFKDSDYHFIKNPSLESEKLKLGLVGIIKRLRSSYKERTNEVITIAKHIKKSPHPIIICGDFNDTPLSYAYRKLSKDLNDTFIHSGKGIGQTFNQIYGLRIDYILTDKRIKSFNFKVHKKKLSDHYPISCQLKLN